MALTSGKYNQEWASHTGPGIVLMHRKIRKSRACEMTIRCLADAQAAGLGAGKWQPRVADMSQGAEATPWYLETCGNPRFRVVITGNRHRQKKTALGRLSH